MPSPPLLFSINPFSIGRPKIDFNSLKPPPGYVAGMGRGAAGFTTRSDVGPARYGGPGEDGNADPAGGQPPSGAGDENGKFDNFMGNEAGMLVGKLEDDDKEADAIWESVDDYMDQRRRQHREENLKRELEKYRKDNPKITEQFRDLKRKLGEVDFESWDAIPEIGDYTIKRKRELERYNAPANDAFLMRAQLGTQNAGSIDVGNTSNTSTGAGGEALQDLRSVGTGKKTMLSLQMDKMSDDVEGKTTVDPKGYMTAMASTPLSSESDIQDIKRVRQLFKSMLMSNRKHPAGWIGAARLEERAGKLQTARNLIMEGVEACPTSEDVWVEAVRLQTAENAKSVIARGVTANPLSVKLWMEAMRLETTPMAKSRVLRKGLERVPTSVVMWKAAVDVAGEDDARVLLARAVECCPQHAELWLALARLETYANAKKVLNKARLAIPTDRSIWLTASMLEEAQGNDDMPAKIIPRAVKSLEANGVVVEREQWLEEARLAEARDPPLVATCRAIVTAVVGKGVEMEDRENTWVADAEEAARAGATETARAIFAHALATFPARKTIWRKAATLEKKRGDVSTCVDLLRRGTTFCPQDTYLWLMWAKETWLSGDVDGAREVLDGAFHANPESEDVFLAAYKLEAENGETERARMILARARDTPATSTERVWMYAAKLERGEAIKMKMQLPGGGEAPGGAAGGAESAEALESAERSILVEATQKFPTAWKLWLMLAQLEIRGQRLSAAREVYARGTLRCPGSVPLWRAQAAVEAHSGNFAKARAILDTARLRVPESKLDVNGKKTKNPDRASLWLASVRVEAAAGDMKAVESVLARALQECPHSGALWAENIKWAAKPARKSRSTEGLKKCDTDPYIFCAVAQLFLAERKLDKARTWFNRSVITTPDLGDHWAHWYRFELAHGTSETQAQVREKCGEIEPKHGERWQRVAKDPCHHGWSAVQILEKVVTQLDDAPPIG